MCGVIPSPVVKFDAVSTSSVSGRVYPPGCVLAPARVRSVAPPLHRQIVPHRPRTRAPEATGFVLRAEAKKNITMLFFKVEKNMSVSQRGRVVIRERDTMSTRPMIL